MHLGVLQGRSGGGYIGIYTPPNQSTLNVFMWLFCLLDPFIPTQIKFLTTPLVHCTRYWTKTCFTDCKHAFLECIFLYYL